jgi:DnaJ-class molecular chaperone
MGGASFSTGKRGGMRFAFGNDSPFGGSCPRHQQAQVKGSDLLYELHLTIQEVATGTSKTVRLQHNGRSENVTINCALQEKVSKVHTEGLQGIYTFNPKCLPIRFTV